MVQQLLNEPDLDAILQWSVMQKFMDELSETEEEASGSSDDMALGESLVALESRRAPGRRPHPGTSVRRPRRWLIGCIIRNFQVLCLHRPHDLGQHLSLERVLLIDEAELGEKLLHCQRRHGLASAAKIEQQTRLDLSCG